MKRKGKIEEKGQDEKKMEVNMGQNKTSPFLSPPVLLSSVAALTRWRKGSCSITLSSETEIRVLSLELSGTHTLMLARTDVQGLRPRPHAQKDMHTSYRWTHTNLCLLHQLFFVFPE